MCMVDDDMHAFTNVRSISILNSFPLLGGLIPKIMNAYIHSNYFGPSMHNIVD